MLAARDQENLTHGHRVAASSKPLNQAGTNIPPKTPAIKTVKTPFRAPLRDENIATGKAIPLKTEGKPTGGRVLGKNAFVTPFGPRNRAPLGQKTTNAKAKPFQTPTAPTGIEDGFDQDLESASHGPPAQTTSHPLETVEVRPEELEEREIEYMPPKPKELLDIPDDIPHDIDYSPLKGANLTRGWYSTYCNPIGEDGLTLFEREMEIRHAKVDEEIVAQTEKLLEEIPSLEEIARAEAENEDEDGDTTVPSIKKGDFQDKKSSGGYHVKRGPPSTISSRQAASMLSKSATTTGSSTLRRHQPMSAASSITTTTKSKSRLPFSNIAAIGANRKKGMLAPEPTNPSEMRHAAATAASRSTMGYAKGRAVSGELARGRIPSSATTTTTSSSSSLVIDEDHGVGIGASVSAANKVNVVKGSTLASTTRPRLPTRPRAPAVSSSSSSRDLRHEQQRRDSKLRTNEHGQVRAPAGAEQRGRAGRGGGRMKVSEYFYFLGQSDDDDDWDVDEIVIDPFEGLEEKTKKKKTVSETEALELEGDMKALNIANGDGAGVLEQGEKGSDNGRLKDEGSGQGKETDKYLAAGEEGNNDEKKKKRVEEEETEI